MIGGRGQRPDSQSRSILAITPTGSVSVAGVLPVALSDLSATRSEGTVIVAGGTDRAGQPQRGILTVSLRR